MFIESEIAFEHKALFCTFMAWELVKRTAMIARMKMDFI